MHQNPLFVVGVSVMNRDAELTLTSGGEPWLLLEARLKKLRRERHLVEKAIRALQELSRVRQSRAKRQIRS